MKVIIDNRSEYSDVLGNYYGLSKHNDDSPDEVFFQGYDTSRNVALKKTFSDYTKKVYLNLESPCSLLTTQTSIEEHSFFTHVLSICPYTSEWLRDKIKTKFIVVPFPISLEMFKDVNTEKIYDVIYMGTLMNNDHRNIITTIKKHNHIFTSLVNYPTPHNPTHVNVNSKVKWDLLGQTKICVTINQAPFGLDKLKNIKSYDGWENNKALNRIHDGIVPQFKSRVTESMGLKTLNLVKRDEWNVIEEWFTPDVHFIYWDDFEDLDNKIKEISENFDNYKHIIDNAYEEVKKYDMDNIFNNLINNGD
jgi:spore maturation protein CgeB